MGRRLPKRPCPKCGRLISIKSHVTRNELRDHVCDPGGPARRRPPLTELQLRSLLAYAETGEHPSPDDFLHCGRIWQEVREAIIKSLLTRGLLDETWKVTNEGYAALIAAGMWSQETGTSTPDAWRAPEDRRSPETPDHVWTCPRHGEQRGPKCMTCGAGA